MSANLISRLEHARPYKKPRRKNGKTYWYWFVSWRVEGRRNPVEVYLGPVKRMSKSRAEFLARDVKRKEIEIGIETEIGTEIESRQFVDPRLPAIPSQFLLEFQDFLKDALPLWLRKTKLEVRFNLLKRTPKRPPVGLSMKNKNGVFQFEPKTDVQLQNGVVTIGPWFPECFEIPFDREEMVEALRCVFLYNKWADSLDIGDKPIL